MRSQTTVRTLAKACESFKTAQKIDIDAKKNNQENPQLQSQIDKAGQRQEIE